jgi:nucleoside-diphosphate-sugar epimerase
MDSNIASTVQLAQLASRIGCRAFVGTGSQAEYGPQNRRLAECAATTPTTLYGAAKLAAYHFCRVTLANSGVRLAWMRIFSCYGPKDNPGWLIPGLIESLLNRRCMPLTGGEQMWDYLYAPDAARAIALAGTCERAAGVFNVGSGTVVPLRTVVESIRDQLDPSLPLAFGEVPYQRDQVMHLQADVRKLRHATGWKAETRLNDGLIQTIAWVRATHRVERLAA